ncbi:MAG: type II secretion system F family protein, partial [Candidatus Omnitrophota bacterium]
LFPAIAVNALRSGEHAGSLPQVMMLLADHFDLSERLKSQCLQAFLYPAGVIVLLCVALVYISQVVVPQLQPLLPAAAMDSFLTRSLLAISALIREAWIPVLCAGAGVILLSGGLIRRYPDVGHLVLSRIPVIGQVCRDLDIALCFFDIFVLLRSGISLDAALGEAALSARNMTGKEMVKCRERLSGGYSFSGAMARGGYFPRFVVETIRLGEEMGRYDDYCERVFRWYYRSFEMRINMLAGALQPALLTVCASFVMVMALAFLKPVYANLSQVGMLKP